MPSPSAEARAHSELVVAHIAQTIATAGGWISFADYMGAALYAPGLGYYSAGARKFGREGDFVTAPELTPLFGRALATQLADVLAGVSEGELIELGPGTGRLAADVLAALAPRDALPTRYRLMEISPDLRARQDEYLRRRIPELFARVEWVDDLPERWRGVVIVNEVLDAVPPHLVVRRGGDWFERGVALDAGRHLTWSDRPLARGTLRNTACALFPPVCDYVSEINPAAQALVKNIAQRCETGALLVMDYGFPAAEYYHPQRSAGTLMTHYRHRALSDPFFLPGLADLTAHVDFSAIAHAGVAGGMTVAGFTTQAHFLINCGILDELTSHGDVQATAYLRSASAVQKLLSPAEMGEHVKVLAMARGMKENLVGFHNGDRTHSL